MRVTSILFAAGLALGLCLAAPRTAWSFKCSNSHVERVDLILIDATGAASDWWRESGYMSWHREPAGRTDADADDPLEVSLVLGSSGPHLTFVVHDVPHED